MVAPVVAAAYVVIAFLLRVFTLCPQKAVKSGC